MSTNTRHLFSASRIAHTAWFVVSVYYGLLIGETSKEGLALALVSPEMSATRLWIIVPTLFFYFFSAAEAYLWLNPRSEEALSGEEASFRGLLLGLFLISVVAQSLLMRASNDPKISGGHEFILWLRAFAAVMILFALYNVAWVARRLLFTADGCPPYKSLAIYVGHYLWFAFIFVSVAEILNRNLGTNPNVAGATCALLFASYMCSYLLIWWGTWHKVAISAKSSHLYSATHSNDA